MPCPPTTWSRWYAKPPRFSGRIPIRLPFCLRLPAKLFWLTASFSEPSSWRWSMPSKIPVVWYEGSGDPDNRSHYADAGLINETFDAMPDYEFLHCNTMSQLPPDSEGAVI